ncbi:unnamed protein product [Peronospora belbahrii]|uniref:FYVE-type domain-containing protein n=1 Tax=Peronospora belbahrii TaxID=622444 RepID=A0ABN8D8K5_9STRA|nr:unnamed protein product [Peronospora belbahrii]
MRSPLQVLRLVARSPSARSKHRKRSNYIAVTPPSINSSLLPSSLLRPVRVDDRELFCRARRVQRLQQLSRSSDNHSSTSLVSQGWRSRRQKKGFELYTRQCPISGDTNSAQSLPLLLDSEVLAVGNVACSIDQLALPLSSPSEGDYNSVMHSLYGSDFIYGSLVHKATFRRRSHKRGTDAIDKRVASIRQGDDRSNQLLVKTSAFACTSMFDKKNQQMCYGELFSPTPSGGFSISTFSLAGQEVIAGKVRVPLRRTLHQLHPFSTWFSAEPASTGVHVIFRARFHRSESDGSCPPKVMNAHLWKLVQGVCKLEKLVDRRTEHCRELKIQTNYVAASGPRNSRCIVCTRTLNHIFMTRSCRRCELCSYNVCNECCSRQHVTICNRHVTPLLVCTRCRERLAREDFDSQLRAVYSGSVSI